MTVRTLLVHLDDLETGAVSFKTKDAKGARWRTAKSIYAACDLTDLEEPFEIDYVLRKT